MSAQTDSAKHQQVSSGIVLSGSVITVGGDIVRGDKIVYAIDTSAIDELFEPILVEVRQHVPSSNQAEAGRRLIEIREQAKSYPPNLIVVGNALKWLKDNAPDFLSQLKDLMRNPLLASSIRDVAVLILGSNEK